MDKISVIVPVYNVEKYLDRCLESLVNQTYDNYEVLVINDGTKDNSQLIIDKYAINYPGIIKVFVKENGGLSDTRNYGLNEATGNYIMFVDSDDYVDKKILEKTYNKIIQDGGYDMVVTDLYYEYPELVRAYSNLETDNHDIKFIMNNLYPSSWAKLYKKELFDKNKFKKNIWFEDVELLFRILPDITKVGVIHEPLYYYIQRNDSITYTYNEKLRDIINNWDGIIKYYIENDIYSKYKEELEYSFVRYALATYIKRLAKCKNKQIFSDGVEFASNAVYDKFPNYKKNSYLNKKGFKNLYLKNFNKFIANIIYIIEKNKKN